MIEPVSLFLQADGRLGRGPFWIGVAGLAISGAVLSFVPVIGGAVGLVMLWPWYCLMVKRLHDIGRSGRLAAVALVPMALAAAFALLATFAFTWGPLTAVLLPLLGLSGMIAVLASIMALVFVVWLGLKPGEMSANRWGAAAANIVIS